jgi:hypothetical protein
LDGGDVPVEARARRAQAAEGIVGSDWGVFREVKEKLFDELWKRHPQYYSEHSSDSESE